MLKVSKGKLCRSDTIKVAPLLSWVLVQVGTLSTGFAPGAGTIVRSSVCCASETTLVSEMTSAANSARIGLYRFIGYLLVLPARYLLFHSQQPWTPSRVCLSAQH